jgi:L-cysteine desulfidase
LTTVLITDMISDKNKEYIKEMNNEVFNTYLAILKKELVPALGCTEPIAVAYAAAKARAVLGCMPEHVTVQCSGNIIKNVMGVTVPNSQGMKGVDAAAVLGVVGGDASAELEVLAKITESDITTAKILLKKDFCSVSLKDGVANLYIAVSVHAGVHTASVKIVDHHTNITEITKDDDVIVTSTASDAVTSGKPDYSLLTVNDIFDFALSVPVESVKEILDRQIAYNSAVAQEGLEHAWGAQIGRTIYDCGDGCVETRAVAKAAAGSDARMAGCALPVVINSGSGNQGMTVSLPVIEYARELGVAHEVLYRALVISNLVAIHQKSLIGSLSAFCGAVSAAMGVSAAVTYLQGGDVSAVSRAITNTIADAGGIICDGAKSSCAAKIATSLNTALLGSKLALKNRTFQPGEGIVKASVEETICAMGYIGRIGMKDTDRKVLSVMIGKADVNEQCS